MELTYKQAKLHYTKSGKGPAVVLLHGFLESSVMWDFLIEELKSSHTLLAIDLPGHGNSECLGYIHTMETMAEAVEAILHYEKIPEATLVGHSMGGYVCLALIEKNPKLCHNLLLLNSNTVSDSEEKAANRDRAIQLLKTHREAYIKMAISNLFAETTRLAFEPEIEALKEMAMQFPVQGIIAALEGMKIRKDRTQLLKKQKFPKHLIAGKNDPIMPSEDLKQMAYNTHAFFYEIDGGHMSTIENRTDVLEVFRKII